MPATNGKKRARVGVLGGDIIATLMAHDEMTCGALSKHTGARRFAVRAYLNAYRATGVVAALHHDAWCLCVLPFEAPAWARGRLA